ncbi:MAG: DUF898 domain-containing protein [Rhizobiales bacterium]|nr:DUF898 domain-containing protein [Hyphomicrobiales bacterium]
MNEIALSPPQSAGEQIRIEYVPRQGLLSLSLVNFALGLLTLTFYRFWAKTNVRKHIWSCVHINGQPLEYTGRGIELFLGAIIVFLVFGLPAIILIMAVSIIYGHDHAAVYAAQSLLFLVVAVLWGAAIYRARRYQLSRTLWRGIRGTMAGSSLAYSLLYFGSFIARGLTLGWITPVMNVNLQEMMIGGMRFGDRPFRFKGRAGPLYPSYALCWVLTIVAVVAVVVVITGGAVFSAPFITYTETTEPTGLETAYIIAAVLAAYLFAGALYSIIWSFYTARELRVFASYTSFDNARFSLDATAGSLISLVVGNLLIWIFTLGIGTPYVQQRMVRYLCDRTKVEGTVDVERIAQSQAPLGKLGEGLADAFDVGGI